MYVYMDVIVLENIVKKYFKIIVFIIYFECDMCILFESIGFFVIWLVGVSWG